MPFALVALQTDNGSEFLKHFDKATGKMLITHYFSHPYCPQENAHVERKIQTTKYELWAFKEGYTVAEFNEVVDELNYAYNNYRPHQSLGYLTPNEFLKSWYDSSECAGTMCPRCSEPAQIPASFVVGLRCAFSLLYSGRFYNNQNFKGKCSHSKDFRGSGTHRFLRRPKDDPKIY